MKVDRSKPRVEYAARLAILEKLAGNLRAKEARLGNIRMALFLAGLVMLWLVAATRTLSPWWLLVVVAAFAALGLVHDRVPDVSILGWVIEEPEFGGEDSRGDISPRLRRTGPEYIFPDFLRPAVLLLEGFSNLMWRSDHADEFGPCHPDPDLRKAGTQGRTGGQ